ncbi:MAG: PAS domain-containing protein [Planctomycetes bacterium]|nr:PAS domain-containing protein [Planctomycetota bacterium]
MAARKQSRTEPPLETPPPETGCERAARPARAGAPVVGIGSSAGGLEALQKFFRTMPADSGLAFVIITHLDPVRESHFAHVLARHTAMPVEEAAHGTPVAPNCVYVIPPGKYLSLHGGVLHLSDLGETGAPASPRVPIDFFFRSLAEDCQERAIGIVLSGTGSEGALGLKEIHAQGGLTLVQAPDTAGHGGMPRSAIATGAADLVLPVEQMPPEILRYSRHPYVDGAETGDGEAEPGPDYLTSILALVHTRTRRDFRRYKKNTIRRRVERRMGLHHIVEVGDYLNFLRENPAEVSQLFRDLLIGVTSFFRDRESWDALAHDFLAPLVAQHDSEEAPLRVWAPGCATGEEAYSAAIVLQEQLARAQKSCGVQAFATDINEMALDFARAGLYPVSIAADVSPERLRRFFLKLDDHAYQVSKPVRESVAFAIQDLISDPPFSKLDLIICRNLLIYLEPEIQHHVISLFHFALRPGGGLFLGSSEGISRQDELFEPINKKWHLYRRVGSARRGQLSFPIAPAEEIRVTAARPAAARRPINFADITRQALLAQYTPASVLVNKRYQVLYLHGPVSRYLQLPVGEPTLDLLSMAHEELGTKLRAALHRAFRQEQAVVVTGVRVKRNGDSHPVRVTVRPVKDGKEVEGLYLVTFEDEAEAAGQPTAPIIEAVPPEAEAVIRQLEYELKATREDLQSTVEEVEATNEEQKASNEEIMSINEELQAANEELETSKEELESLNEELSTVNAQLQDKVEELEGTNNDLANLLACTDIATIFLDTDFAIKRFTPAATRLINLIPSDVGRPLSDIATKFIDAELLSDARQVLENLSPLQKDIEAGPGRWYIRRILPYRTQDNRIDGVVATFIDVTPLRQAMEETRARVRQQAVLADLGLLALAGMEPPALTREVVRTAAETLGVEFVEVLWLSSDGSLRLEEGAGWGADVLGATLPAGTDSQQGFTILFRAPVLVVDVATEKRFARAPHLVAHGVMAGVTVLIHGDERPYGVLGAHTADRRRFSENDVHFLQTLANLLAEALDRHRHDEERKALTTTLEQRVEERTALVRLLQDVAVSANEADTVETALGFALHRICEFGGWSLAHVYQVTPPEETADGENLVPTGLWYSAGEQRYDLFRQVTARTRYALGEGLPGEVLQTKAARWVRDLAQSPTLLRRRVAVEDGLHGATAFPILVGREVTHVLEFFSEHSGEPDPALLPVMAGVGTQLGRVVERQRLQAQLAEVIWLEQRRLGQELHDTLGQELTGTAMIAKSLEGRLTAQQLSDAEVATQIVGNLQTSLSQVRDMARGLFIPPVDARGLSEALRQLTERTQAHHGIPCRFVCKDDPLVRDDGMAVQLYQIAKEALTNAIKHSRATEILVQLGDETQARNASEGPTQARSASEGPTQARSASEGTIRSGEVRLEVRDNGVGMPDNLEQAKGMGVRIMRYRAALIGASLQISAGGAPATAGRGGTVVICIIRQGENDESRGERPGSPGQGEGDGGG